MTPKTKSRSSRSVKKQIPINNSRRWLFAVLLFAVTFFIAALLFSVRHRPGSLDLSAPDPIWTIDLTGNPGDVTTVWVWTRGRTALTNVVLPAKLRLRQSCLLMQASNRPGGPLKLAARHLNGGSANVGWITTTNNSVTFVSTLGRILPRLGGYGATVAPFGSRPTFKYPWSLNFESFEPAAEFSPARSETP